jgi:hypothetical protein
VNPRTQSSAGSAVKCRYVAALLLMCGSAWLLESRASAQLGSLVVTITAPAQGATVSGTTAVVANVSIIGSLTVSGVQFKLDGANLGAEDTTAPYSIPWNTATAGNGSHTLTAVARVGLVLSWTSDPVAVTVLNDPTPPTVSMTAPSPGAIVRGSITITASASDNVGVAGVQFRLDGANLGAEDTTAPYSIPWDTTTASNSSHALTAVARDASGNLATAAGVTITVDNSPPTVSITSPVAGATVSASITISATAADNLAVAGVQFFVDGAALSGDDTTAPYSATWDTTTAAEGAHTLTAVARDSAGHSTTSAAVSVTVTNAADTVTRVQDSSPAILFTPAGTWVEGYQDNYGWSGGTAALGFSQGQRATFSFSGTGVSWIGFRGPQTGIAIVHLDGAPVATVDPYHPTEVVQAVLFTATGLANGTHTLAIEVTQTKNAAATDYYVVVDAFDITAPGGGTPADPTPPTVGITSPANGATVSGTTTVTATAADNVGVAGVRFFVDGALVGAEDTSAPYEVSWNTTLVTNGSHTVTAQARDAAGNTRTSAPITVTVSNTAQQPYAPGDLLVSLEPGPVQWRTSTGLLRSTLAQTVIGTGEGMALDASGNLYVTRWCIDPFCGTGDTGGVEKYNTFGQSLGRVGPAFNCSPHTILFAAPGTAYVGQAGCNKTLLKTALGTTVDAEYAVATELAGVFWMDLGADGCTMYYTSSGANVKRFDVCGNAQLSDFNVAPLPGDMTQDLRVLPDGGVLVSSGEVIVRLDSTGAVTQTYAVPGENVLWSGLDLAGDGTFWVGNYRTSNVYRFNLTTGAVVASFNTGTPANTVVGIRVVR